MWPWEFIEHNIDPCLGPSLFEALYRLFRVAYHKLGNILDPKHLSYHVNMCKTLIILPLGIQEQILQPKIGKGGHELNFLWICKVSPILKMELRYSFILHGKHKHQNLPISNFGYGNWQGTNFIETIILLTQLPLVIAGNWFLTFLERSLAFK